MSNYDTNDFRGALGLDQIGDQAESSLAASLFEEKDKGKSTETKESQDKEKTEKAKQEEKTKQEEKVKKETTVQDDQLRDQATLAQRAYTKFIQQAFLDRADYVQAVLKLVLTTLQTREQSNQAPQQEQVKAQVQAGNKQIAELGKAPEPVHQAYITQLSGQTIQLEEIAKVNAWRAFNGTDVLSTPKDKSQPDERLAQLGRSLVETKNLIAFNKPIDNLIPEISKTEWTKDIQSITNQNDVLSVTQKQVLTQLIDRKVQTLQAVLNKPELTHQAASLLKDEKALNAFLVQTEARMFPTPIVIPAEAMQRNQMTPRAIDALAEQAARQQFPNEDALSLIGRQLSQAQSYLDKGKVKEASSFLDPAKSGANSFADFLKPFANADLKDPTIRTMLSDKLAAVKEIFKGLPRDQEPQLQLVNTKFLDLMQANIASQRAKTPLPLELEASRQATLYFVKNPAVIDHIIQDKPEPEVRAIYKDQIIRKATDLAQHLPNSDIRYSVPVGTQPKQPDVPLISKTVIDITAPKVPEPPKPGIIEPGPQTNLSPKSPTVKLAETVTAESKPAENKAVENTTVESKITESKPAENKTAENKAAEITAVVESLTEAKLKEKKDNTIQFARSGQDNSRPKAEIVTAEIIDPGAPPAPIPTPQFSMAALNSMFVRVATISETLDKFHGFPNTPNLVVSSHRPDFTAHSFAPLAHPGSSYFRQSPTVQANTTESTNPAPAASKAETIISPHLVSYNEAVNYGNVNIPSPFQAEQKTHLTGSGLNLDGANRGVMASGGQARTSNSSFLANKTGAFAGPPSKCNGASCNIASGPSAPTGGSKNSSSGAAGASPFAGSGLLIGFQPSWHHGFLNPLRGNDFALNGINPFGTDKNNEEDKDDEDNEEDKDDEKSPEYYI